MSRRYLAVRTSNLTIDQACVEIIAGARPFRLLEIAYISATATAQTLGLGRPAAKGVTPTSPVTMLGDNLASTDAATTVALAWATSPTAPTAFMKRAILTNLVGQAFTWDLRESGIVVPVGATLVLWNITASVASDVSIVVDD